jgi:hypothetical protein
MADEQSGIVFKSNDGDTYFIRDEILDACRVQPDEQAVTDQMVEEQSDDVGGFAFSFAQPVSYTFKSSIAIAPNRIDIGGISGRFAVKETIMCCW